MLGLLILTKDDIDILTEYMQVMKPLAAVLDVFQGDKSCFMGLGVVLPLLKKVKQQVKQRAFPNIGPLRVRIVSRVEYRDSLIPIY